MVRYVQLRGIQTPFIVAAISVVESCGGAVGSGTGLGAEKSRVLFPMVSSEFSIDILPAALESIQPLIEMSTRNISWG